jgi:hypothetical protein
VHSHRARARTSSRCARTPLLLTWHCSASSLGVFMLVDRLTCGAVTLGVLVVTFRALALTLRAPAARAAAAR